MSDETSRAKEIDDAVKAADKKKADAAARADADAGEKLDNILKHLDSLGKRMDAYDDAMKRKDEGSDDERTAKSWPPSSMNPINDGNDKDGDDGDDPTKPRPIGADSRADSIRADAEEIAHFKAVNGATYRIEADSVLASIQSDADKASSAWGKSSAAPWAGEKIAAYRRRVARPHQSYSAAWRDVDLATLSGQALRNATAQIFADSIAASSSPETYGETLREVRRRDPDTGCLIKEYYGQPRARMQQFAGGPPRLARFNLDKLRDR
jgi:hypothetical protein